MSTARAGVNIDGWWQTIRLQPFSSAYFAAATVASRHTTAPVTSWGLCLLGAAVAGIVGYWALKFLLRSLKSQWFWLFGPYCLVAGAVALLLS